MEMYGSLEGLRSFIGVKTQDIPAYSGGDFSILGLKGNKNRFSLKR